MLKRLLLILCFLFSATSLMAVGSISGVVTTALGVPLPGATVTVLRGSDTVIATTTTAGDGSYSFSSIPAGEYVVRATLLTFQTAIAGVTVLDGQNSVANFSLATNPGAIAGQVLDSGTLLPITGATVHAIENDTLIGSATTDGSGNYTINGLAAGSYIVTAAASSYQTGTMGAAVLSGQTTTVNFFLVPSPGIIAGTVTSASGGMPISSALIQVSSGGTVIYSALTNGSGNYTITGVSAGSYTVTAAASTYDTAAVGAIVASSMTTTVNFSLESSPGAISGTVTNSATGLPTSGALVEANLGSIIVGSAITDNSGHYSILGMAPGSYIVDAYAATYQTSTTGAIVFADETTTVNFSLEANPGTLSGTVTSAMGGSPITGALVQVLFDDIVLDTALTDSSGNYTITGLAPGSYTVTAAAATFEEATVGAIIASGETTTANFSLETTPGSISGTVISAVGSTPISGALIEVTLNNAVIFSTLTGSSGDYEISGVAPGSYMVNAHATNYQTGTTGAIVVSNTTTTVDFSLVSNPGTIAGRVTSAASGLPISGALVEVNLASIVVGSAVTDSSGNYSISGVAPGSYIVDAYATNYQTGTTGAIALADQTTTTNFSLQPSPGTISGTVTSATGGAPLIGALIQVIYDDAVIDSIFTDSLGNYTVTGLAPGSYTVTASAATHDTGIIGALVFAESTTTVDFSLATSPGSISGTVITAIGSAPIAGAVIEVTLNNQLVFSTLTDSSGDYEIGGVAPGSYVVHAHATNYQTGILGAIVISNMTATVDFALVASPGTISGTVTSATTGLPIAGALVEVNLENILVDSALTDASGHYTISDLAPGSYILDAYATNYQTGTLGALVLSGQTTTVDFLLQPDPGTISGIVKSAQSGLGIPGARVEVSFNDAVIFSTLTDSSGQYSISGVPPASYIVDAYAENFQTGTINATVSANQTTTVNFSLQSSPGAISGIVLSAMDSSPIAGALVEVNLNNILIFSTLTNSLGNYFISGVAPNTYNVHAHAVTYQTAINHNLVVVANMTATSNFSLQSNPAMVHGTITDAVTGLPLSGVFINIFEEGVFVDVAVTDPSGNYSVTGLAADSYSLTASKTNYDSNSANFTATAGGMTTVDLALDPNFPPRNLTGQVIVNAFLLQADRIHHLQWTAAIGGNIANYRVYRNGTFLATVSPNGPLEYDDHNRNRKVPDNYTVTAVNTSGNESSAVSLALQ